jgi:hypothetical protein
LSEITRLAAQVPGDTFHLGQEYASELGSTHVAPFSHGLRFTPENPPAGSGNRPEHAYAFYTFSTSGYTGEPRLELNISGEWEHGRAWAVVPNYPAGNWDWLPLTAAGVVELGTLADRVDGTDGPLVVALALSGARGEQNTFDVEWIRLGAGPWTLEPLAANPPVELTGEHITWLDSNATPHATWHTHTEGLVHAVLDGESWNTTQIVPPETGEYSHYAGLTAAPGGPNGRYGFAYLRTHTDPYTLAYTFYNIDDHGNEEWMSQTGIDYFFPPEDHDLTVFEQSFRIRLAHDSEGDPHMVYYLEQEDELEYRHLPNAMPMYSTILVSEEVDGIVFDLDVDTDDNPHIAYSLPREGLYYYTTYDQSDWMTVSRGGFIMPALPFVGTAEDNPRLLVADYGLPRLFTHDGSEWSDLLFNDFAYIAQAYRYGTDSSGFEHAMWCSDPGRGPFYAFNDGSGWTVEVVYRPVTITPIGNCSNQDAVNFADDGTITMLYRRNYNYYLATREPAIPPAS